jgi:hypothetical protein
MLRWLTVQISLAALQFITSIIILTTVPSIYDTEPRAVQRARRATIPFAVSRFVTSAFVGWQMVGIASIGIAPDMECIKQRPSGDIDWVYTASYFNIIVNVSLLMIYAAFWLCIVSAPAVVYR